MAQACRIAKWFRATACVNAALLFSFFNCAVKYIINSFTTMLRNVEIKAVVRDVDCIMKKARELSNSEGEVMVQYDTFFNVLGGRLKLRNLKGGGSQLISYKRPDGKDPKLSEYKKCEVADGSALKDVLTMALGIKGSVAKTRHLFMVNHTRVHIDDVDGLGHFVELEVMLSKDQTIKEGAEEAKDLMLRLGVANEDLVVGAYMDLLHTKNPE